MHPISVFDEYELPRIELGFQSGEKANDVTFFHKILRVQRAENRLNKGVDLLRY